MFSKSLVKVAGLIKTGVLTQTAPHKVELHKISALVCVYDDDDDETTFPQQTPSSTYW